MALSAGKTERLARRRITAYGSSTTIDGSASTPAVWTEAGIQRVQMYLNANEWDKEAFDIHFIGAVLSAPFSMKNGSEIVRVLDGWRGVVRLIDPHPVGDTFAAVTALVVLATT